MAMHEESNEKQQQKQEQQQQQSVQMSSWGCNSKLDVFMWIFVIAFVLMGLTLFSLFLTCATDQIECTVFVRYVIFCLFIALMFGSCLGCIYFCSCSLSKEELAKRQAVEQARTAPLVIRHRKYSRQNSDFLKNVIYEQPSQRGFELLPQEDMEEKKLSKISKGKYREFQDEQNKVQNIV